jgi:hypothetical protein
MNDVKERLAQRIAAAQSATKSLVKVAGEDCEHESAKDPEQLIDGAADVQVEGNIPAGVTAPGEKSMSDSGLTPEDKGTDIGHVETNGPGVEENAEVKEMIDSPEEFEKKANALIDFANQILSLPDSAFGGVAKVASAEITDDMMEQYIVKRANAGDPVCQGMLNYCAMIQKMANEEELGEVAEGAELEAAAAEAQEQVAAALIEEHPELTEDEAMEIAGASVADVLSGEGGEMPVDESGDANIEQVAGELVDEVAGQLIASGEVASEEEANALAIEAVADVIRESTGGIEGAEEIDKTASAEDGTEEVEEVEETPEGAVAEDVVEEEIPDVSEDASEVAGELILELAQEIQAQDPSISDEDAAEGAADALIDAIETSQVQQAVGATDENGEPVVDDETAAELVDELDKTASANPMRALLTPAMNGLLGLSPEGFAARRGLK